MDFLPISNDFLFFTSISGFFLVYPVQNETFELFDLAPTHEMDHKCCILRLCNGWKMYSFPLALAFLFSITF